MTLREERPLTTREGAALKERPPRGWEGQERWLWNRIQDFGETVSGADELVGSPFGQAIVAEIVAAEQRGAHRALRESADNLILRAEKLKSDADGMGNVIGAMQIEARANEARQQGYALRARADALPVSSGDEVNG